MELKQVVVVGGGVAGCTAAIEAAKLGLAVTLIDEHPQTLAAMSLDAPYYYGAGLPNALSNRNLAAESILNTNPLLMECFDSGVDVLTGTCVWGSYRPGENSRQLETCQLGLADENRSWMMAYEHLILAPGARDLVLPFPNWQLPGVFGACGGAALFDRYTLFDGNKLVILGSGNLALRMAQSARRAGVQIVGVIEVAPQVQGDRQLAEELEVAGVPFFVSHTVVGATGKLAVEGIRLTQVGATLHPTPGSEIVLPCDSICMAFGAVPNVELAAVSGCKIVYDAGRGGWCPDLDNVLQTSQDSVYVIGHGAAITEETLLDHAAAQTQAKLAVQEIARRQGLISQFNIVVPEQGASLFPPWHWHRSLINASGLDVMVCQCEEVTRRELLDVSPPRYLDSDVMQPNGGLAGLSSTGRVSQDLVKRMTRAGMGHCQGKRCRDHTTMLLADASEIDLSAVFPGSYRTPVRPIPLNVLSQEDESEEMRRDWRTWVHASDGIPET